MKKTLLILSLLLSVALVSAQSDDYGKFAYGFGIVEGDVGNYSFTMGHPFYSLHTDGNYTISEGVMQAQLSMNNIVLAGCQLKPVVSVQHVQDTSGFFMDYTGIPKEIGGSTVYVFPAGHYDSTAYNTGHYYHNAQYNYDSLTTLDLTVWEMYETFDTLYLDSTELALYPGLHGGPNAIIIGNAMSENDCDSIDHHFVNLCGGTIRDADGNPYASLFVGDHPYRYCWTKSNMKTTHYNNGDEAPGMIYYSADHPNTTENLNTYGRLYNWYSTVKLPNGSSDEPAKTTHGNFVTGICPIGWHVPDSLNTLSLSSQNALDIMSDILWVVPGHDTGAGFYALPAGYYNYTNGRFENMLAQTYFWSSVRHNYTECWVCSLLYGCNVVFVDDMLVDNGISVRCVKNQMYADNGDELND